MKKNEEKYCPLCGGVHEILGKNEKTRTKIKGEEVEYDETFYYCPIGFDGEHKYVSGKLLDRNLLNARNAYRKKHGLLTSDEIVNIRKKFDLNQVELAKMMGFGEATISRYESKAIQDESYDLLLRMVSDDPSKALELLDKNRDRFDFFRYSEIRSNILALIEKYGRIYTSRNNLAIYYSSYNSENDNNGNTLLNIEKIEAIISYMAERVKNLYTVKLNKILWFVDSLSFSIKDKAMTGLIYLHLPMGAVPIGYKAMIALDNVNTEEGGFDYPNSLRFLPNYNLKDDILDDEEKKIIDNVIDKFKDYSGKEISEYMHNEQAYKLTKANEIIPFSYSKDMRGFD